MPDPLILYVDGFWISPWAFTAYVALREKQLRFETVAVPLQERAHLRPEYQSKSVTGRVPALEHGDFALAESSAIVEYLEEVFPAPGHPRLLPADGRARARARQILAWVRSDLGALREDRPTTTLFYERAKAPLTAAGAAAAAKLVRVAERLVPDDGGALFGAFSIADADLAFLLQRLVHNGHDVPPKVRRFAETLWARPSIREFVDRQRPAYVPY